MQTDFDFHIKVGFLFSLLWVFFLNNYVNYPVNLYSIIFILTFTFSSILPDVDLDYSHARHIVSIILGLLVSYIIWSGSSDLQKTIMGFLITFFVVKMHHLQHRSSSHNLFTAFLFTIAIIFVATYFLEPDELTLFYIGLSSFLGYILHLFSDNL